jgi:hypothetical protein
MVDNPPILKHPSHMRGRMGQTEHGERKWRGRTRISDPRGLKEIEVQIGISQKTRHLMKRNGGNTIHTLRPKRWKFYQEK